MSRQSRTKDERFLLELFLLLKEEKKDSLPLSIMEKKLALTHSTAKNIASLLAQTGFITYSHRNGDLILQEKGRLLGETLSMQAHS